MSPIDYGSRLCAILFALSFTACAVSDAEPIEDLGSFGDGKTDTLLPRSVEVELAPGASKRFRITTPAFFARLDQSGDVLAELTAKHYEFSFTSDVSRAPHVQATADATARAWTLTVFNRGTDTLAATLVVDVPRRTGELGIVSDIDKTILPPETTAGMSPPYPGIAEILTTLEGGSLGDVYYVTARTPDKVVEVPAWMTMFGVPAGPIDTGISGVPWVAQKEKVADISRIFDARVGQSFVLFGDTAHRDPEVYAQVRGLYPDQVAAIFIHKVDATVPAARVAGMHLINNYAEAAAIAFGLDLMTEAAARAVIEAAKTEGLVITAAEIDALIDAQR